MSVETEPPPATADGCVATLQLAVQTLLDQGWTRTRIDQLGHPTSGRTIRHHYSSGEWTITVQPTATSIPYVIRYGTHRPPISPERLLRIILGRATDLDRDLYMLPPMAR